MISNDMKIAVQKSSDPSKRAFKKGLKNGPSKFVKFCKIQ